MIQPDLLAWEPPPPKFGNSFDGATFEKPRDGKRLNAQLNSVYWVMRDGQWRTLHQLSELTNAPMQSCSARLRDLRKTKFLGGIVERRFISKGLFEYRLIENKEKQGQST